MKKLHSLVYGAILAILVCGGAAFADDSSSKGENNSSKSDWQAKRVDHMAKELSLTADQKSKLAAIFNSEAPRPAGVKPSKDEMKAKHQAEEQQIKAILTPDQLKKYDEMSAKQGQHHHKQ